MKRTKLVSMKIKSNVVSDGFVESLGEHNEIGKNKKVDSSKSFSSGEDVSEELHRYQKIAGLLFKAKLILKDNNI